MTDGPHPTTIDVVWEGGQRFRGSEPGSEVALVVDGARVVSPSPVDALVISLGACSGVDVVDILEKRRTPPEALTVSIDFTRAPAPPRRVTTAHMRFQVRVDSEPHHVERAIALSLEKYCSVSNTFGGVDITWEADVTRPAGA